ncbi:hypothetical protein [Actinomadura sp. 21ATH]|uniref:hypothetical protein n=1 Tax=Actinomadura sp. 21ATH TaxID=1735444 RepID=UPI0035C09A77
MRLSLSRPPTRTLALAATTATAAMPLALTVPAFPAHAATTTWKVVNPAADGRFNALSTGSVTIKNKAGMVLLTCSKVQTWGDMASKTTTDPKPVLAVSETLSVGASPPCVRPDGTPALLTGTTSTGVGRFYYTATGHDSATGTTTLTGTKSSPYGVSILAPDCRFSLNSITASYNNSSHTLRYTSAAATPFTDANQDGSTGCPGVSASEIVTLTAEFKVDPGIKITRTVS